MATASNNILRMAATVKKTGLSRSTIYTLEDSSGKFPRKIQLTERTTGFLESEVDAWIADRAANRSIQPESSATQSKSSKNTVAQEVTRQNTQA
jgi:predicted DNA-binding transcriptional regulator AlpA